MRSLTQMAEYARGFLVTSDISFLRIPSWWNLTKFGNLQVCADPRVQLVSAGDDVLFLGHAIDIKTGSASTQKIVNRLCDALKIDLQSFYDAVNDLCGRFVVVYKHNGIYSIQQDAIGMRSVFFGISGKSVIAGSHPRLVAEHVGQDPSIFAARGFLRENNMAVFPGRFTEFEHVRVLTPNTELSFGSGETSRFYFGSSRKPLSTVAAAQVLIQNSSVQAAALKEIDQLRLSLSAGLDSRVTLALLRSLASDSTFFTYDFSYRAKNKASMHDSETAALLASKFRLDHSILDIKGPVVPDTLASHMNKNMRKAHSRALAAVYLKELSGGLHIRSNGYEIGRGYYQGEEGNPSKLTGEDMLRIVSRGKSRNLHAIDAFNEYIYASDFNHVKNVDPLDLFYWEHRMGVWMTPILIESDIAHDTHILVNHRPTLEAMLAVPLVDRIDGSVLNAVVDTRWPALFEVPVNGLMR